MTQKVETLIATMAAGIEDLIRKDELTDPVMIGIHNGGAWVAQSLHRRLGLQEPLGTLDITFYRDDFTHIGLNPQIRPSDLPFDVEGRDIILVDDILHTGRTIRAAMNEIFDYGRPARIKLGVLVERSRGRELPIRADVAGERLDLGPHEYIKLSGPDPLDLHVQQTAT